MGEIGDKKMFLDSAFAENRDGDSLVLNDKYQYISENLRATLFSRGRRTESFFTEDSRIYVTPKERKLIEKGVKINRKTFGFDGIKARIVENYRHFRPKEDDFLYKKLVSKYQEIQQGLIDLPQNFSRQFSLAGLWNVSIATAIIVGMVSMTFIYRYLGVGASAEANAGKVIANAPTEQVLGAEDAKIDIETTKYIEDIFSNMEESRKEEYDKKVKNMVKGYPIEKMLPYILQKDRIVAAFLIGIAKKESGWGEHVPVYKGQDCFNLWGYKGKNPVGSGGHSCFSSPQDAVDTVATRIKHLVESDKLDTPAKISVWKCGSKCKSDKEVGKWISDVSLYFEKLN